MVKKKYSILIQKGVIWPAFAGFWASWAPPNERSRLIGLANAGSQIGNVYNSYCSPTELCNGEFFFHHTITITSGITFIRKKYLKRHLKFKKTLYLKYFPTFGILLKYFI